MIRDRRILTLILVASVLSITACSRDVSESSDRSERQMFDAQHQEATQTARSTVSNEATTDGDSEQKRVAVLGFRADDPRVTVEDARKLEQVVREALRNALSSELYQILGQEQADAAPEDSDQLARCEDRWPDIRERVVEAGKQLRADLIVLGCIGYGGNLHRVAGEPAGSDGGVNISLQVKNGIDASPGGGTTLIGASNFDALLTKTRDSVAESGLHIKR